MTNCWMKTGILLLVSNEDVELAQNTCLESIEREESEIYKLVVDLTEDTVAREIDAYREVNQTHIPTEETLNDTQIVETVLAEQLEYEQGDSDDSDKEPPKITAAEGISGLKSFILFAEQQMCDDFFFNNNDLKVFRKYLTLMKQKITESMNQKPITDFFKTADQSMSINNNFFNEIRFFDDGNVFPDNDNFFGGNNFLMVMIFQGTIFL
ncbi:10464_t:CDS:1 [Cetraspora pellucida]|uniref:10464_t:CDS:1 n=1 Tax=Cetraspora pellucida TaxID=1433469 RepID=A0A9N9H013_9GLOM|nr:10464_t:CDS:1 [Cetraspora pellucida]